MRVLALRWFLSSLTLARHLTAQEQELPRLSFRLAVDFIEVTALVTDTEGRVVPNLARDDFQVLEDGRPQALEAFAFVDLPRRPRPRGPDGSLREPEVRTNREASGRLLVLLIDDLRTPPGERALLLDRARELVDVLGEGDLVSVLYTSGRQRSLPFTTSRARLLDALAPSAGRGPNDSSRDLQVADIESSLSLMEGVAGLLETITGRRKTVIYFGPGSNYDLTRTVQGRFDDQDRSYTILMALQGTVGAANRGGVSIYAVDPRGIRAPSGEYEAEAAASAFAERESLHFLAEGTGGFAVYNTNAFSEAFDRIVDDNSRYYLLAYRPTNEKRDGKDRAIEVRLRDPSLRVRARQGYRAPRREPPDRLPLEAPRGVPTQVVELLRSPVPIPDLPMSAVATPTPGGRLAIVVELDVSALSFEEEAGNYRSEVSFGFFVLDEEGKVEEGSGRDACLALDSGELGRLRGQGLRALSTLPVGPGRHQVAVAARERSGGKSGLLYWQVEVPERGAPSVSEIVLSSAMESGIPVLSSASDRERLPLMPTVRREFDASDVLWLQAPPGHERVGSRLLRGDGTFLSETGIDRKENPMRIALADLTPGGYVLELALGDAKRTIPFRVRAPE